MYMQRVHFELLSVVCLRGKKKKKKIICMLFCLPFSVLLQLRHRTEHRRVIIQADCCWPLGCQDYGPFFSLHLLSKSTAFCCEWHGGTIKCKSNNSTIFTSLFFLCTLNSGDWLGSVHWGSRRSLTSGVGRDSRCRRGLLAAVRTRKQTGETPRYLGSTTFVRHEVSHEQRAAAAGSRTPRPQTPTRSRQPPAPGDPRHKWHCATVSLHLNYLQVNFGSGRNNNPTTRPWNRTSC